MENQMNTENLNTTKAPKEGGVGATIGIIVILIVLAAGGVYVWMSKNAGTATSQESTAQNDSSSVSEDAKTEALMQTSSSDSASAIEADLEATDTGSASSDLQVQ